MHEEQGQAGYATGAQTVEPDAAFARLCGTIANLRAEDLPGFLAAKRAQKRLGDNLEKIEKYLFGARLTFSMILTVSVLIAAGLLGTAFALLLRDVLDGYDFAADPYGRIAFYCALAILAGIAFGLGVVMKLLTVLIMAGVRRKLRQLREDIARSLRDIRSKRSAGIGHSLSRIGIGEAGLSIRSNTRHLKLRWNTFDPKATRERDNGTPHLPEVPATLRMPVSLATLDACQAQPDWRGFLEAVEGWARQHDRLELVLHRNLEAEREFTQIFDRPPLPAERSPNWRKPRYVERDFEDWEETLPIHKRFFDGEDSDISWPQFVFFAVALIHSRAQPPEGIRERSPASLTA